MVFQIVLLVVSHKQNKENRFEVSKEALYPKRNKNDNLNDNLE